jgi:hypothetical protein
MVSINHFFPVMNFSITAFLLPGEGDEKSWEFSPPAIPPEQDGAFTERSRQTMIQAKIAIQEGDPWIYSAN